MAKEIREVMNISVKEVKAHAQDKKSAADRSNRGS